MGQRDSQKKRKFWEKESFSFVLSLISVSIVFIFLGYLMGQYGLKMLEQRSYTTTGTQQLSSDSGSEIGNKLEQFAVVKEQTLAKPESQDNTATTLQPTTATELTLYKVQVGAFSQRDNAQRLVNSLKELGYEAIITSGPPFRVQTGAFSNNDNAKRYAAELEDQGFEVTIVRP